MMRRLPPFVFVLMLMACSGSPTEPGGDVAFQTVAKEQYSGIKTQREEVVTTQERWNAVWSEIMATRSPKPPTPAVDFSQSSVIVIARGDTADSCRTIEIEGVAARSGLF